MVKFQPLAAEERNRLIDALRGNVDGKPINMRKNDTSFLDATGATDEEVISAVKSVPCHY